MAVKPPLGMILMHVRKSTFHGLIYILHIAGQVLSLHNAISFHLSRLSNRCLNFLELGNGNMMRSALLVPQHVILLSQSFRSLSQFPSHSACHSVFRWKSQLHLKSLPHSPLQRISPPPHKHHTYTYCQCDHLSACSAQRHRPSPAQSIPKKKNVPRAGEGPNILSM